MISALSPGILFILSRSRSDQVVFEKLEKNQTKHFFRLSKDYVDER